MERLSYETLKQIGFDGYFLEDGVERILQIGEGNFLRAFVDYFVDLANERTGWNAKVVVAQPIAQGKGEEINRQNGLYTVYLRGIQSGRETVEKRLVSSISRCINPYEDFEAFMKCAENPELRYLVSNTTEAGIVYDPNSLFEQEPPGFFPGKLTRFLYRRYQVFGHEKGRGFVTLSCELIDHNGDQLKSCVKQYIQQWKLGEDFERWVEEENIFCSTMVDRIVTGYPAVEAERLNADNHYEDRLLDTGEIFAIWVIEGPKELEEELPFKRAGLPVIVADDCTPYKKKKVRMLNGVQTTMALASYLSGEDIVRKCMDNSHIRNFMKRCLYEEIIPVLTEYTGEELTEYGEGLFERLENPFIDHSLLAISLNTTAKWKARVLPTVKEYVDLKGEIPICLAAGFAAYICFYRGAKMGDGCRIGFRNGAPYRICDDPEVLDFYEAHKKDSSEELALAVCKNTAFWGEDLSGIPGFLKMVTELLCLLETEGAAEMLRRLEKEE